MVIGFQAELVQATLRAEEPRVRWVVNHEHATTNSLASLASNVQLAGQQLSLTGA